MPAKTLSDSAYTATINAPIDWVNIGDWLLTLPDAEYQRCCPPDHVAAGSTTSFEQAAAARQAASSNHNSRETPLFAKSIERRALATH
jgi:hypothetical protein